MFTNEWQNYWGLERDPFSCEDADKDFVLSELDSGSVHSGFDRIYGDPRMPAPGIVFGEKGSGKSGLRLMMKRRLEEHNADSEGAKVFIVEYIDFNAYLEHFRGQSSSSPEKLMSAWSLSDHIDSLLSIGTTQLVDGCLDGTEKHEKLSPKQKLNLLLLTSLYYNSKNHTASHATRRLTRTLRCFNGRKFKRNLGLILLTLVSIALAAAPHAGEGDLGPANYWYIGGGLLLAASWIRHKSVDFFTRRRARRAAASIRVLPREPSTIADVLASVPTSQRAEYTLPESNREEGRYELLQRLFDLTDAFGYSGWYILLDRVDEPSLLSGDSKLMSQFIEKLLDIKLLQYPGLALKLFLPIELETLYRTATPEDLKRMRLDKSNLIPELKWGGQELYEIANKRLRVCLKHGSQLKTLDGLFDPEFDLEHLRSTMQALGTPRYSFGFLSSVVLAHVNELPGDLAKDDPAWRIPLSRFEVERAAWIDRTGLLRRTMN